MARLAWTTTKTFQWHDLTLPCASDLEPTTDPKAGYFQIVGIRPTGFSMKRRLAWPVAETLRHALGSGFIERAVGQLIRKHVTPETDFLEFGCGPMNLRRYLPRGCWYNAIDIAFSEFQLRRVLKPGALVNVAIASAKKIPLPDDSVSMIASVEVVYCIPNVDEVFAECRRVLRDGGVMICSIANARYHKYKTVGPHPDMKNDWTFQSFIDQLAQHGFESIDTIRRGYWVPITKPSRLTNVFLPIEPKDDDYTSNFIYAFRLKK